MCIFIVVLLPIDAQQSNSYISSYGAPKKSPSTIMQSHAPWISLAGFSLGLWGTFKSCLSLFRAPLKNKNIDQAILLQKLHREVMCHRISRGVSLSLLSGVILYNSLYSKGMMNSISLFKNTPAQ